MPPRLRSDIALPLPRGTIAVGKAADLAVFDPATVADTATFETPQAYPVGIPHVVAGGRLVVTNGALTGALPGQVLSPS